MTYKYTECGLDYVCLSNGYREIQTAYGKAIEISNIESLHQLIGQDICARSGLTGQELKFLRRELGLSQSALGNLLDKTDQSVAKWEKDEVDCPRSAEAIIKKMYLEHIDDTKTTVTELLERLADLDDHLHSLENGLEAFVFKESNNGWTMEHAVAC